MILSNVDILKLVQTGGLVIEPFDAKLVRGASVCLRLGPEFKRMDCRQEIDIRRSETFPAHEEFSSDEYTGFLIPPKTLILASTLERIILPLDIAGWLSNLSGLARLGLQVVLSSLVSPGYGERGATKLTLELLNSLDVPIRVYPKMRICHLTFWRTQQTATVSYDAQVGTYAMQAGPRESRFYTDFELSRKAD
jgi:dCTP deaminase